MKLDEHFASDIQQKAIQFWKNEKKSKQFFKLSFEKELKHSLDDSKENWRVELTRALKSMSPQKFETFARGLVKEMGVKLDEKIGVSYTNDGGLDGFGYITSTDDFRTNRVAIQAKVGKTMFLLRRLIHSAVQWISTMQNMVFLLQLLIFQEVPLKQLVKGLESLL